MCGIAGWIDGRVYLPGQQAVLDRMSAALARRGPDDSGQYLEENVCLLHRRLKVVDPEGGRQPMTAEWNGETYTLVYNGELYNAPELRAELEAAGCPFSTRSDTEVLLWAYAQWGEACLSKLNGIFAFAVWEKRRQRLFAARDRLGVKPFFFALKPDAFLFGSELKALLQNPLLPPRVGQEGLKMLFLLGPAGVPGQTVFEGIEELKPGECLTFSLQEGFEKHRYWKLFAKPHEDSEAETVLRVRELLTDSIRRQLVSDVPLCTLLSGGLDSSILSAVAAKAAREHGETLTTYSVDYVDNARYFKKSLFQPNPDSDFIGEMVRHIGSNHKNIVLDNVELADALRDAVHARDVPGMADVDSSMLLLFREIKRDFTVGLSGECADEIFGGYPWYHREEILFEETFPWSRSVDLRLHVLQPGVLSGDAAGWVHAQYQATVDDAEKLPGESRRDARMREMFRLNTDWFMQTLLTRKDRMSMYWGLEMRVPFCDHRLVEYAYNMPWEYKNLHGREKGVLREAFQDLLPARIAWRKKSPYPRTFSPVYFARVCDLFWRAMEESPLKDLLNLPFLKALQQDPDSLPEPWYGQLMRVPQIFAYLLQMHWFLVDYGVTLTN